MSCDRLKGLTSLRVTNDFIVSDKMMYGGMKNIVRKCLPRCFSLEPEAKTWQQFVFSTERAASLERKHWFSNYCSVVRAKEELYSSGGSSRRFAKQLQPNGT